MTKPRFSLLELCHTGYWFCQHCECIVILGDEKESPAHCPRCKKQTAEWQHPLPPLNSN